VTTPLVTAVLEAGRLAAQDALRGDAVDPPTVLRAHFQGLAWGMAAVLHRALLGPPSSAVALGPYLPLPPDALELERGVGLLERVPALLHAPQELGLAAAYEAVLSHDLDVASGRVAHLLGNDARKRAGAFYTPMPLARACAHRALDQLVRQRLGCPLDDLPPGRLAALLSGLAVADYACGAGRFLLAWLELAFERLGPAATPAVKAAIAGRLVGVDLDPLVLVVTRASIALAVGRPQLFDALAPNFVHANPLLEPSQAGLAQRLACFAGGRLYAPDLGPDGPLPTADVVLGNPPWGKLRLEERPFFRAFAPEVSACTRKGDRRAAIARLAGRAPLIHAWYSVNHADVERARGSIRSGRFPLSAVGELDTYALFTELGLRHLAPAGCLALLVKSGLCTTPRYRGLFSSLVSQRRLVAFWDFINSQRIFAIDNRERFALVLLGDSPDEVVRFAMGLVSVPQLGPDVLAAVQPSTLERINPLTGMLPNASSAQQLGIMVDLATHNPSLDAVFPDANFGRIVHLTAHSDVIHKRAAVGRIPVLEGKFIEQYNGRFAGFAGVPAKRRYVSKARARALGPAVHSDPLMLPRARYFVEAPAWQRMTARYPEPWSIMWRNTTSASNRRACIATLLPHQPGIQSVQLLQLPGSDPVRLTCLLAVMNSLVFDWLVRHKLNGIDLTQKVLRQVSVPAPQRWSIVLDFEGRSATLARHVSTRVASLLADDARLQGLTAGLGVLAPTDQRRVVQRQLDRLVALAYGVDASLLSRIASDFEADLTSAEIAGFAGSSSSSPS
jgi:hypothetical protein